MRYTGPKMKLCRREQINLFGSPKYQIKKKNTLPGQHGANMQRHSEYGKLLRNKQVLKRMYFLTENQFVRLIKHFAGTYAKNKNVSHDVALFQFLERRLDAVLYRSGLAKTIMQARQMVGHGHMLLNGTKHNVPSTFAKIGDVISLRPALLSSPLYAQAWTGGNVKLPSWLKIDKVSFKIEVLNFPQVGEVGMSADLLKVIEFYARA